MKRFLTLIRHPIAGLILRVALGCIFIYSGATKLHAIKKFAEAIENYQLLPVTLINAVALLLPWLEVLAGLAVLSGLLLRGGAAILILLLLVFTGAIAISIANGVDISCGCSLPFAEAARVGWKKLIDDLILLAAAWSVYRYGRPAFSF